MRRNAGPKALVWAPLLLLACAEPPAERSEPPAPVAERQAPLEAFCTIDVVGTGVVDVEEDYIPHVVQCENGAADYQALKAQAVAARSYLYYRLQTGDGSIRDGQVDQVYSCNRNPTDEQRRAARETAGQVLSYRDVVIAGFYVAGAIPSTDDCVAAPDDNDPTNTERYVTYNEGLSGDQLEQTSLGWINPGNHRNRGCKSQNGANCLSRRGWDYTDILRFYYGADIRLESAVGACVPDVVVPDMGPPPADMGPAGDMGPPPGDMGPPPVDMGPAPDMEVPQDCPAAGASPAIVDDSIRCFTFDCRTGEWGVGVERGFNGGMLMAPTIDADDHDCVGRWHGAVRSRGEYDLAIYIEPGARTLTRAARYHVAHADGEDTVTLDQRAVDGWAQLGRFTFDPATPVVVWLGDATGEPFSPEGPRVAYDALRISPPGALMPDDAGLPLDMGPPGEMGLPDALPVDPVSPGEESQGCRAAPGQAPHTPWGWALVGLIAALPLARRRGQGS